MNEPIIPAGRRTEIYHLLLIALSLLLVFGNTLWNGFAYDDTIVLANNEVFSELKFQEILFGLPMGVEYFPLRDLSLALDFWLFQGAPFGFHLTNLLLYMIFAAALYYFILTLTPLIIKDTGRSEAGMIALVSTVLFTLHPIHSESVNFIVGRGTLLSGLFFILASLSYLKFMKARPLFMWRHYIMVLLFFSFSMLSKSYGITLPLILWAIELSSGLKKKKDLFAPLPVLILAFLFFILFKFIASGAGVISYEEIGAGTELLSGKAAVALQIPFFYVQKLLIPTGLSPEYDLSFTKDLFSMRAISCLLALSVATVLSIVASKRRPLFLFCLLWFILTLIPFLQIFPTGTLVADRYLFVPSMPFFYLAATALLQLVRKINKQPWKPAIIAISLIWGGLTINQNTIWKSDVTLWSHVAANFPRYSKAYVGLGSAYARKGETGKALENYRHAGEIDPARNNYEYYRGKLFFNDDRYEEAALLFKEALDKQEGDLDVLLHMGLTYEKLGRLVAAAETYSKALSAKGMDPTRSRKKSREGLKRVLKKLSPQLDALRIKVQEGPGDIASLGNLAITLDRVGLYDEAIKIYGEITKKRGESWQAHYNIANIHKKREEFQKAKAHYLEALRLSPSHPLILNNLGLVYKALGETDKAIETFEGAMRADINSEYAPFNLAKLYFQMGKRGKARHYFNYTLERFPQTKPVVSPYLSMLD